MVALFVLAGLLQTKAQDQAFRVFDQSSGFTKSYLNHIERDSKGYLWLGTDKGVVRFDGSNFIDVPARNGEGGNVRRVRIIQNKLYVFYYDFEEVDRIDLQDYSYATVFGEPGTDLVQLPDSSLVMSVRDGRLIRLRNDSVVQELPVQDAFDSQLVFWNGYLFLQLAGQKVMCLDPVNLSVVRDYGDLDQVLRGGFQSTPDKLVINVMGGVYAVGKDLELKRLPGYTTENFDQSFGLGYWSDKLQYFIRGGREVVVVHNGTRLSLPIPGEKVWELRTLYMLDSVNILLGASGSLIHFRNQPLPVYSTNQDDKLAPQSFRVRRNIIEQEPGKLVLTGSPGFIRWEGDRMKNTPYPQMLYVSNADRLGDMVFGVSENRDIISFDLRSDKIQLYTPGLPPTDQLISVFAENDKGTLVIGGLGNIFRFHPESKKLDRFPVLGKESATLIRRSPNGEWWVATYNGLFHLDTLFRVKNSFSRKSQDMKLTGNEVSDIFFNSATDLWVSHDQGLQRLDLKAGKITDSIPASWLPDKRVTAIRADRKGRLWFSTYNGILGFDPVSRVHIYLGKDANLVNKEFNRRSAAVLSDGRIIFGGTAGYDIIDPEAFDFIVSRPDGRITAVEWFTEDGNSRFEFKSGTNEVSFNIDDESIRFYLSSLNLLSASGCRFEFRLNEGAWREVTGGSRLEIIKLNPGSYRLEFRGFDPYGTLLTFPELKLDARVAFYKSINFIIALSVALLMLSALVLYIMLRSQRREKTLKENIAMDLHDEVGTLLTRALLVNRATDFPDRTKRLEGYLSDAAFSLRAYINTMNKRRIPAERLTADLQEMVQSTLGNTGIKHHFTAGGTKSVEVTGELYRDVKLSLFELLSNVIKHSGAGNAVVQITHQQDLIWLTVSDDGKLAIADGLEGTGNGLANLGRRARRHNGSSNLGIAAQGHGLEVKMEFKIQ